jgi:hypothetical protein
MGLDCCPRVELVPLGAPEVERTVDESRVEERCLHNPSWMVEK